MDFQDQLQAMREAIVRNMGSAEEIKLNALVENSATLAVLCDMLFRQGVINRAEFFKQRAVLMAAGDQVVEEWTNGDI